MRTKYTNPLPITGIGDPFVMRAESGAAAGRYFLYATSAPDGFLCWESENLVDWKAMGYCFRREADSWATDCFWAPECTERDGRFYLFYSANWAHNPNDDDETFRIGVAVADHPAGPFRDVGHPLFDPGFPVIDANVFVDADGRAYLTCSRCCYKHRVGPYEESHIYGAELQGDWTGIRGELQLLLRPQQEWENQSEETTGRRWNEGSTVFRHGDTYFMTFSANHYQDKEYAVGYATAEHPLGPWRKAADNPILAHDYPRVSGPGHNSIVRTANGAYYIVYHAHTDPLRGGFDRQVYIDRLHVEDGRLRVDGPTTEPQEIEA